MLLFWIGFVVTLIFGVVFGIAIAAEGTNI